MKKKRVKTTVRIDKVSPDGTKSHYKSITIDAPPIKVWKALCSGGHEILGKDLDQLRSRRKRPGGR